MQHLSQAGHHDHQLHWAGDYAMGTQTSKDPSSATGDVVGVQCFKPWLSSEKLALHSVLQIPVPLSLQGTRGLGRDAGLSLSLPVPGNIPTMGSFPLGRRC